MTLANRMAQSPGSALIFESGMSPERIVSIKKPSQKNAERNQRFAWRVNANNRFKC
jgi:hypothetical protein